MKQGLFSVVWVSALLLAAPTPWGWALSVTPGRTEVRLEPGKSIRTTIRVTNDMKELMHIEVSQKDWFVLPANKAFTADQWLQVQGSRRFDLAPGATRTVPVKVKCPEGAQGELVGMVSFQYLTSDPSMVTPMISVSTYLAVMGTEKAEGEIVELGVRRWQKKLQPAVAVKSTGNVHLRPTGTLVLTTDKDQEVARYTIPSGDPAYPGQVRGYIGQGPDVALEPGHYVVKADLTYGELHLSGRRGFAVAADGQIRMDETK